MAIDDELKHGKIVTLTNAMILKCPFRIMVPEHYKPDGTCRCDDIDHAMMEEWGYKWDGTKWTGDEHEGE